MQYHIHPASPSDAEAWLACIDKVAAGSVFDALLYPKELAPPVGQGQDQILATIRTRLSDRDGVFFKVVDADGIIVGYVEWSRPKYDSEATAQEEEESPGMSGLDVEVFNEFTHKLEEQKEKVWSGGNNYWYS